MEWKGGGRLAATDGRGKLASAGRARHHPPMRRTVIVASALLAAGCASRPVAVEPTPIIQESRSDLLGMTASDLVQRFGTPALQIREGTSLKLQFRGAGCVLDAYLYPPVGGRGAERVTHVDARLPTGG
jgi:hypothetical protein